MNAKRNVRGLFVAAAAALLVVIFSAFVSGTVSAKASEPEMERRSHQSETEVYGIVTSVDDNMLSIGDLKVKLSEMTEMKDSIKTGDSVKIHAVKQADGTYLAREVEKTEQMQAGMDDKGGQFEAGDDKGNHAEPGDDKGNHPELGDDHGGKSGKGK